MPRGRRVPEAMRVQKYVAQAGLASRRQAEALMREGRIAINGVPVQEMGTLVTPGVDTVAVDGRVVEAAPQRWVVFHKPRGVLCTRSDPHGGETIYALLPAWAGPLRYVGRLDRDTSGLLLLTNDGDMGFALAHPSGGVEREYVARVRGRITARALRSLRQGMELEDGFARPRAVRKLRLGDEAWGVRLVLAEGRKREVRRLLKAVGHPVVELERTRFGPFRLGRLKAGNWRPAHASELAQARALVRRRGGRRRNRSRRRQGNDNG
ncbi:MAG: pseudouridine synthase [Gemmatimonadota bacterium]|nr:pseudouridine synthase [Gemmatimonadota bacterium]MDE2864738.1 pseudouridine synthase [Gemmatimonadota bacterium]